MLDIKSSSSNTNPQISTTERNITVNTNLQLAPTYTKTSELGDFQKILLRTNGSVTRLLETHLSEPIKLVKLSEYLGQMKHKLPNIKSNTKGKVLAREVLLQGKNSCRNLIYASSKIFIDNLEQQFSDQLLNSKTPIGKLWSEQKVETYKEIIDYGKEPANELSNYFSIAPDENLFFRTYTVFSQRKLTMMITEKFPESYFCQKLS